MFLAQHVSVSVARRLPHAALPPAFTEDPLPILTPLFPLYVFGSHADARPTASIKHAAQTPYISPKVLMALNIREVAV